MLSVTIQGQTQVINTLGAIASRMTDLTPAMRDIGRLVRNASMENFKDQHAPDGTAWQSLKASTIAARRKGKGAGSVQILRDIGTLMNSVVIDKPTATGVTVASRIKYSAIHQYGGTIQHAAQSRSVNLRTDAKGKLLKNEKGGAIFAKDSHKRLRKVWGTNSTGWGVTIPARPYLGLTPPMQTSIIDIVQRHIRGDAP